MNKIHQKILVLDFGGQYNQLIARRVRDLGVYAEVKPYTTPIDVIKSEGYIGVIFTGGPNSVYEDNSPKYSTEIFELGVPVLGICYGAQLMAYLLGGEVKAAPVREYGKTEVTVDQSSPIFEAVADNTVVWMSHTDYIAKLPEGFSSSAHSDACPVAAMENSAVPSGSAAHRRGGQDAPRISLRCVQGGRRLDNGIICG